MVKNLHAVGALGPPTFDILVITLGQSITPPPSDCQTLLRPWSAKNSWRKYLLFSHGGEKGEAFRKDNDWADPLTRSWLEYHMTEQACIDVLRSMEKRKTKVCSLFSTSKYKVLLLFSWSWLFSLSKFLENSEFGCHLLILIRSQTIPKAPSIAICSTSTILKTALHFCCSHKNTWGLPSVTWLTVHSVVIGLENFHRLFVSECSLYTIDAYDFH